MSGISMALYCLSTFEITRLLGGGKVNMIGNVIEQQFTVTGIGTTVQPYLFFL